MTLRSLTLAFAVAFLVATVSTGVAIHSATHATIVRLVDRRIANVSDEIAQGSPTAPRLLARIAAFARQRATGDIGFVLRDARGRWLGGNVAIGRVLPAGFSTLAVTDRIAGLTEGRALVRPVGDGLVLTTVAETEPVEDYNAARTRIYLIGFGSIVVVVLGGVVVFGVIVSRRIGEMRRTVEAIIDGDMTRRVPVDRSGGSFAQQAAAFNRMLDRIEALMTGIRQVSSDVAHDLRTPLARLRSRLALLARHSDGTVRDGVEAAIAEADDVLALFAATLRVAEVEGDARAGFATLDLGALVDEVAAMMAPVVADAGLTFDVRTAPAPISGDRQMLVQALVNLIANALAHAAGATRLALTCAAGGVVTLSDDGPGIAPDDRALALRRFGRLDRSRHRAGHGLGLPLAVAVARLHRGDLMLEDVGPGLRVVLRIPGQPPRQ